MVVVVDSAAVPPSERVDVPMVVAAGGGCSLEVVGARECWTEFGLHFSCCFVPWRTFY